MLPCSSATVLACALCLLASACNAGEASSASTAMAGGAAPAPDSSAQNAATPATAQLELLSLPREALGFGEQAQLAARVTNRDGEPIEGTPVRFALMGRAQDASLAELEVASDEAGEAHNILMAGEVVATFRVRVSAPGADEIFVEVRVSNAGFGTLLVDAPYEGARTAEERTVAALPMMDCDEAERMAGDPMATLSRDTGDAPATFLALPADVSYAVVAIAIGEGGTVVAQGCVDGVKLSADDEVRIAVDFQDIPLLPEGRYAANLSLDARAPGDTLVRTLRDAAEAAVLDGAVTPNISTAEAAFLLDSLESTLASEELQKDPGIAALAEGLAGLRADPGEAPSPSASLAAELELDGTGPRVALMGLADAIGKRFVAISADAELRVEHADATLIATWHPRSWSAAPIGDGAETVSVDLSALADATEVELDFDADTDGLEVLTLVAPSGLGALTTELLRQTVGRGLGGRGDTLRADAGCGTLAAWLPTLSLETESCGTECLDAACDRAIARMVSAAETALLELDANRPTVTFSGALTMFDDDGNLTVERMTGSGIAGEWDLPADADAQALPEALSGSATALSDAPTGDGSAAP